jgi:hypothetical protein
MSTYHELFEDFDASDPDLIDKRIAYCCAEEDDADGDWDDEDYEDFDLEDDEF